MWMTVLRWVLPLVAALLPLDVIAQMVVIVLRRVSKRTKNTLDDELIDVLVRKYSIPEGKDNEPKRSE